MDEDLDSLLRRIADSDPQIIAAVADVDRSLIREELTLPPLERVRRATSAAATIARFRRVVL